MVGYSDEDCNGGPELVLGAARGRRAFHLGPDGWLRGVTYRVPWEPGENVARCMVTKYQPIEPQRRMPNIGGWVYKDGVPELEAAPGFVPTPCNGMEKDCTCGFYAYHRGNETYMAVVPDGLRVEGVVEAYGKVVMGPLGFRAQKARVLAVCLPDQRRVARQAVEVTRLVMSLRQDALLLEHSSRLPTVGAVLTWLAALAIAVGGATVAGLPWQLRIASAITSGALIVGGGAQRNYHKGEVQREKLRLDEAIRTAERQRDWLVRAGLNSVASNLYGRVRDRYPDVEVFTDPEAMHAAWPVAPLDYLVQDGQA